MATATTLTGMVTLLHSDTLSNILGKLHSYIEQADRMAFRATLTGQPTAVTLNPAMVATETRAAFTTDIRILRTATAAASESRPLVLVSRLVTKTDLGC